MERFGLPDHTAARFEMPAPALRGLVGSYHVFDSKKEWRDGVKPWLLPSWPAIRFILAPDAIALTIGSRRYDPMPVAALYGNASRAMQMTTHGGVTIGVDLTPLGWSRLFDARANDYRDRVVPLDTLLPAGWVACALDRLRASDRSTQVKAILDDLLLAIVRPPGPQRLDRGHFLGRQIFFGDRLQPVLGNLGAFLREAGLQPFEHLGEDLVEAVQQPFVLHVDRAAEVIELLGRAIDDVRLQRLQQDQMLLEARGDAGGAQLVEKGQEHARMMPAA